MVIYAKMKRFSPCNVQDLFYRDENATEYSINYSRFRRITVLASLSRKHHVRKLHETTVIFPSS